MDVDMNVNPDLLKERATATFDVERMINFVDHGEDVTQRRRHIQHRALKEREFTSGPETSFLTREEHYSDAVRRFVHFNKILKAWDINGMLEASWLGTVAFPWDSRPDIAHGSMFVPTLENQSTDEQKERWLPKSYKMEYIGTYAQTEMGHGTFLRGLETTSTYDPNTEEFVLHTPKISSMKWWPAGLGKTVNCAVVMAQLYSHGTNHGMFPFFVQLRDWETHKPLPGITSGDIGPKLGFNSTDNGYLKFDHYRIPRENMLMKNAEVLKDGTFVRKTNQKKPTYTTMTLSRTAIVHLSGRALAAAMTIAIRYSAIRRQSELKPGAPEPQIMDYQTQQYKLYPYLAMAYGFRFVADDLFEMFMEAMMESQSGKDTMMPETHALSSGLKAHCTNMSALGIEQARFSCGGHGFSMASGLPKIYTNAAIGNTVEGENSVLFLQTARYLMKCCDQVKTGQPLASSTAYIGHQGPSRCPIDSRFTLDDLVTTFEHRARRMAVDASDSVGALMAKGLEEYDARNQRGVMLTKCASAYCELHIIKTFAKVLTTAEPAIAVVLTHLCQLLAAFHITKSSGDFLEDGFMSRAQLQLVREKEISLLADIRPNAVALVDSFDYSDHALSSVLGRYDGNVYENLYKWVQKSPLNKTEVHDSYHQHLQYMIKAKI